MSRSMWVYGHEVTSDQIEAVKAAMKGRFSYRDLVGAAIRVGLHDAHDGAASVPGRLADRLLQRERKAGRVKHLGGGKWTVCAPEDSAKD